MWLLRKITNNGDIHYLISEKKSYTLGRKNCDICLAEDSSISRTHCIINIAKKNDCPFPVQTLTGVWIIDKKSKYGTYIQRNQEWVKIEPNVTELLYNGCAVRFGLLENIWRLEYKPVIACSSRISTEQRQEIKSLLSTLDGELIGNWSKHCTVVLVNDIKLTAKVLMALINGISIVTTNFINQLVANVKQNLEWPDYKLFKPEITESTLISHLVSLDVEDNRKELFKGKTFFIPTQQQLQSLKEIILAAGGKAELLKTDESLQKFADRNSIVVQLPCNKIISPDEVSKKFKDLAIALKNDYQVRIIPEAEILQAVAYSSIDKYCNPKSEAFELRQSSAEKKSYGDTLEEETPNLSIIEKTSEGNVFTNCFDQKKLQPCSSSLKIDNFSSRRKRSHSPFPDEISKKMATENNASISNSIYLQTERECNDFDLFSEHDIEHEEFYKSNEETGKKKQATLSENLQNLTLTKRDLAEEKSEILTDVRENNDTKQANNEIKLSKFKKECEKKDNFWEVAIEKKKKIICEKRKYSENVNMDNVDDPLEKRQCTKIRKKSTEKFQIECKDSPNIRGENSKIKSNFKDATGSNEILRMPKIVKLHDGNITEWINKRNLYIHKDGEDDDNENDFNDTSKSEWLHKNVKKFKKKEKYKNEVCISSSDEQYEILSNTLLAEGWHRSRAYRYRTLSK